jgi:hypothetical protein
MLTLMFKCNGYLYNMMQTTTQRNTLDYPYGDVSSVLIIILI